MIGGPYRHAGTAGSGVTLLRTVRTLAADTWRPTPVAPTRIHALLPRFGTRSVFNKRSNHPRLHANASYSNRTRVCSAQIELRSRHCSSPASLCPFHLPDPDGVMRPSHISGRESGIVQVQAGSRPHTTMELECKDHRTR
jgi:hypothetical protein